MPIALHLVDHVTHIIITIDIAFATVRVLRVLLLVFDHRSFRVEVLVAHGIGASDLHDESRSIGEDK